MERVLRFYRAVGIPLDSEVHEEDGPLHYAAEVGGVHVAVYESTSGESQR